MSETIMPPPIPRPWHVEIGGQAQGPFTLGDLARMAREGRLRLETLVWKEGMATWTQAQFVAEVLPLVTAALPSLPPRPPAVAPPAPRGMPGWVILLIVLACGLPFVAILAAIAVPNFLEAQTRSKVARARGDLRTMTIALETYYLDQNAYPAWTADPARKALGQFTPADQPGFTLKRDRQDELITLTTPVAYITGYFADPFAPQAGGTFSYWSPALAEKPERVAGRAAKVGYIVWSAGPDGRYDLNLHNVAEVYDPAHDGPTPALLEMTFDPSNGTSSGGDIWRIKQ